MATKTNAGEITNLIDEGIDAAVGAAEMADAGEAFLAAGRLSYAIDRLEYARRRCASIAAVHASKTDDDD